MNAVAERPLIAPGDIYMLHRDWTAQHHKEGDPPARECPGALVFGPRHGRGRLIEVECSDPDCHFGLSVEAAGAEAQRTKLNRRLDRLMDDAQPQRGGEER